MKGMKIRVNLFLKKDFKSYFLFKSNAPLIIKNSGTPIFPNEASEDENTQYRLCGTSLGTNHLLTCISKTKRIANALIASK